MLAAPINPADLNVLEGRYGINPSLPAVVGNEGVGVVEACGPSVEAGGTGVSPVRVGQRVIAPGVMGAWCSARNVAIDRLVPVPDDVPLEQGAMLTVNPPTAWLLLHQFVTLAPGDWVVQNAANSAVGRFVIQIARRQGWRTVNVVRRAALVGELRALGADVVVTDDAPWAKQIAGLTGGAWPRLGLNAVGGDSARAVARALAPGGTLVTYGAMAKQPLVIDNRLLIFQGIAFRGFWLTGWWRTAAADQRRELYATLAAGQRDGWLQAPIAATYPLAAARDAILAAQQEARPGKVLFVMAEQ
jgi:NADPH:quinone reductase-like Zn-dependent oxidoreductase